MKRIFVIFVLLNIISFGAPNHTINDIKFINYSVEEGLSQSTVRTVVQGKKGYLWMGTSGGLNRYDGQNFETYYNKRGDKSSLYDSFIRKLFVDKKGNLWVGTRKGLNRYDYSSNSFHRIDQKSIRTIYEDNTGELWIGADTGLYILKNNKLEKIESIKEKTVFSIIQNKNNLYLGTTEGVLSYNLNKKNTSNIVSEVKGRVNSFLKDSNGNIWMGNEKSWFKYTYDNILLFRGKIETKVFSFMEDSNGIIWIATESGLVKHSGKSESYYRYINLQDDKYSLPDNKVGCIYEDRDGNIWVGNLRIGGISKIPKFKYYRPNKDIESMSNKKVWSVYDTGNKIWIGTSDGLNIYSKSSNKYTTILKGKSIWSLMKDENIMWVGTWGDGLYRINRDTYESKNYIYDEYINKITDIKKIGKYLWLGTYGNGLWRFDKSNGEIRVYRKDKKEYNIHDDFIWDIELGENNIIWVGSEDNGICKFNYKTENYKVYNSKTSGLSANSAWVLKKIEDKLWIGTWGAGLNIMDLKTGEVELLDTKNGLVNNTIYGIINGKKDVWVSTNKGLVRIDKNTKDMFSYDMEDGLQNNEFNIGAYFKGKDKTIYFGGIDGLTSFKEKEVLWKNNFRVELKEFKVFNKNWNIKRKYKLNYDENYFSFIFNMINFNNPDTNRYKYKLKGFDTKWRESDSPNVSYTKVPPGTYTLSVYGGNSYGEWGQKSSDYKVKIDPPAWKTKSAYFLYILFLIMLIYLYILIRTKYKLKEELNKTMREEKRNAERLAEAKGNFLANMSHEIRTPMSGILGGLDILRETQLSEYQQKYLDMVINSTEALSRIINEVLEYSKLEYEDYNLEYETFDIKKLTDEIHMAFEIVTDKKEIEFEYRFQNKNSRNIIGDKVRIRQIINNLCSNAIKFTDNGYVCLNINIKKENSSYNLEIIVKDTGIGMDEDDLDKLFDRYEQLNTSIYKRYGGTGLGLSITQKLVSKMDGNIDVISKKGDGTTITVTIPTEISTEDLSTINSEKFPCLKGNILLIEDSEITLEIIQTLISNMGPKVDSVEDGKSGLEKHEVGKYDLVLTDLNLPDISGVEVAKKLRLKEGNIKIIGMSAHTSDKKDTFDSFMVKPIFKERLYNTLKKYLELNTSNSKKINKRKSRLKKLITDIKDEKIDNLMETVRTDDKKEYKSILHKLSGSVNLWGNKEIVNIVKDLNEGNLSKKGKLEKLQELRDKIDKFLKT